MPLSELKELMDTVDTNNNNRIDYNEFLSLCIGEATIANEEYVRYVFNSFDLNRNGSISREEFNQILQAYCSDFRCNEELVEEIMRQNDKNKDGVIDFSEFREAMLNLRDFNPEAIG